MPDGTIFFPDEPILRVTAPLLQSQAIRIRSTRHRTRLQILRAVSGRSGKTYSNK